MYLRIVDACNIGRQNIRCVYTHVLHHQLARPCHSLAYNIHIRVVFRFVYVTRGSVMCVFVKYVSLRLYRHTRKPLNLIKWTNNLYMLSIPIVHTYRKASRIVEFYLIPSAYRVNLTVFVHQPVFGHFRKSSSSIYFHKYKLRIKIMTQFFIYAKNFK